MALQDIPQRTQKVSAAVIIAAVALFFPANDWYENWHIQTNDLRYLQIRVAEDTYAKKNEVIVLAQSDDIRTQVTQIDKNLDFLVKSAAVQTVDRIKTELDMHNFIKEDTPYWRRQESEIKRRLSNAEAYRDCLFRETSENCDASRVW